jgi:hypothetical protein
MNKRHFLGTAALAGMIPSMSALAADKPRRGAGLLTVSGLVGKTNRGPVDPALDQLMSKHGVKFDKAFVFDGEALRGLPAVHIKPTLEYDAKVHALSGPLLTSVVEAAGVAAGSEVTLALRAVDGYVVPVSMANARSYKMIVATEMDGVPLALGGLGPLWAVYEADTLAAFKDKPLKERFALCPWGMYSIEITRG